MVASQIAYALKIVTLLGVTSGLASAINQALSFSRLRVWGFVMVSLKFSRCGKSTALFISIASLMGCPQLTSSRTLDHALEHASEPSQAAEGEAVSVRTVSTTTIPTEETGASIASVPNAADQSLAQAPDPSAQTISYSICSDLQAWQRPTTQEQQHKLATDPRYEEALEEEPLKAMSQTFWQHEILSFSTYALSARVEPMNFAGLWSVADQVWEACYTAETGEQISQGELAEAWLINHRVVGIEWQNDQYEITVQPASSGLQVVQFERLDSESELSLSVVRTNGQPVEVVSGDW